MKLKILDLDWDVHFLDYTNELLKLDGQPCFGVTCYETNNIYIRDEMNDVMTKRTLIHELCHAYAFSYGITFPEKYDKIEEIVCDFFGTYGNMIIADCEKIMKNILQNAN